MKMKLFSCDGLFGGTEYSMLISCILGVILEFTDELMLRSDICLILRFIDGSFLGYMVVVTFGFIVWTDGGSAKGSLVVSYDGSNESNTEGSLLGGPLGICDKSALFCYNGFFDITKDVTFEG